MPVPASLWLDAKLNPSQFADLPHCAFVTLFLYRLGRGYESNVIKSNISCKFTAKSIVWFWVNACAAVTQTCPHVCYVEKCTSPPASSPCLQMLPAVLPSPQCCQETCLAYSSLCDKPKERQRQLPAAVLLRKSCDRAQCFVSKCYSKSTEWRVYYLQFYCCPQTEQFAFARDENTRALLVKFYILQSVIHHCSFLDPHWKSNGHFFRQVLHWSLDIYIGLRIYHKKNTICICMHNFQHTCIYTNAVSHCWLQMYLYHIGHFYLCKAQSAVFPSS